MEPLIRIANIYQEEPTTEFTFSGTSTEDIAQVSANLDAIIQSSRKELDFAHIGPVKLTPEKGAILKEHIMRNKDWYALAQEAVNALIPGKGKAISFDAMKDAINRPWWNAPLVFLNQPD